MQIAGYIYFIIIIISYIGLGGYAAMWAKYNKEKASIYYIAHGLSAALLLILSMIGYVIFKGEGHQKLLTFNMLYFYLAFDIGLSIYTWYKLNPFFNDITKEYGYVITYKKECKELTKFQRALYGCYKPSFNILLLVWQVMFSYFALSVFINFIKSTI